MLQQQHPPKSWFYWLFGGEKNQQPFIKRIKSLTLNVVSFGENEGCRAIQSCTIYLAKSILLRETFTQYSASSVCPFNKNKLQKGDKFFNSHFFIIMVHQLMSKNLTNLTK